jgi:hypothetical protein
MWDAAAKPVLVIGTKVTDTYIYTYNMDIFRY